MKKVNFFISYIREDYDFYSRFYPNQFNFFYSTFSNIDQYLAGNKNLVILEDACNVLIGNSNSPENNHMDIYPILVGGIENIEGIKYFVPLSYGHNDSYKLSVINKGNKYLKNNFCPLLDFMDRLEYVKILQGCSAAVFYHYRQQGMGNLIALLYMGTRVYLSFRNPLFLYFKRMGITIFDFEKEYKLFSNKKLDREIVNNNRAVIDSIFSKEKVDNDIKSLTEILCNYNVN